MQSERVRVPLLVGQKTIFEQEVGLKPDCREVFQFGPLSTTTTPNYSSASENVTEL